MLVSNTTKPDRLLRANVKSIQKAVREHSGDKPAEYRVEDVRGLVLLVMPSGAATWYFFYDIKSGHKRRRRKIKLGRFEHMPFALARAQANKLRVSVESGEVPAKPKKEARVGLSFEELANKRLANGTPLRPATRRDYELVLRKDIFPRIGAMPAASVLREDIIDLIDTTCQRGSTRRADMARAVASAVFSYGLDRGLVTANPASGIRNRHDYEPRDVIATPANIRKLVAAIEQGEASMNPSIGRIALLALLTGQRRTEIAATRKSDVDLESAKPTLTVPRGLAKNRNTHRVPLSPQAVGILQEAIDDSGDSPFVFPGKKEDAPIAPRSVSKAMERTRNAISLGNLRIHDLRRTAGTLMSQHGVPQHVRERIFNHGGKRKGGLTEGVYNRYEYDAEKRAALELLADIIDSIMGRGPAEIDSHSVRLARLTGGDKVKVIN